MDETDVFEDVAKQVRVVRAFKNEIRKAGSSTNVNNISANSIEPPAYSIQYTRGHGDDDDERSPLLT